MCSNSSFKTCSVSLLCYDEDITLNDKLSRDLITKIFFKKIFLFRCSVNLIYGSDLNLFDSPKTSSSYNILKASKQLHGVDQGVCGCLTLPWINKPTCSKLWFDSKTSWYLHFLALYGVNFWMRRRKKVFNR